MGQTTGKRDPEVFVHYVRPRLEATIAARLTDADRRLVEAAAAARGATLSAWLADAATATARRELLYSIEGTTAHRMEDHSPGDAGGGKAPGSDRSYGRARRNQEASRERTGT